MKKRLPVEHIYFGYSWQNFAEIFNNHGETFEESLADMTDEDTITVTDHEGYTEHYSASGLKYSYL